MTILPPGAYIPQINIIKEQKQMGSFSIYVPGILLISNILRVFFWLAVGFPFNLLIQAFLMIAMQVSLSSSRCISCIYAFLCAITLVVKAASLKASGNGKNLKITVQLFSYSQIFVGNVCCHDSCDSIRAALLFWLFGVNYWICLDVH